MGFGHTDIPSNGITDSFSLSFDGTGDCAGSTLGADYSGWSPAYIHNNATTTFWVKMNDFSSTQTLGCHDYNRWYMGFTGTKAAIGVADANNVSTAITITPSPQVGEWLHYTVVADGGTATVYINGTARGTMSYTQDASDNPTHFLIGATYNSSSANSIAYAMNGKISDLATYKVALTPEQVQTIYNGREPFDHNEWALSHQLDTWYRLGDAKIPHLSQEVVVDSSKNIPEGDVTTEGITTATGTSLINLYGVHAGFYGTGGDGWNGVWWVFSTDFSEHSNGRNATCTSDGSKQILSFPASLFNPDAYHGGVFRLRYEITENAGGIQLECGGESNDFCTARNLTSTVGEHEEFIEADSNAGTANKLTYHHSHSGTGDVLSIRYIELCFFPNGKLLKGDTEFSNEGGG
jgi:hypothetical protein